MPIPGYLGIDAGTQGLSVIFTNEDMEVLATGEGHYAMAPDLPEGCYEQQPSDWNRALRDAVTQLRARLRDQQVEMDVLAIGISGQMHGEVLADESGQILSSARLWCDARNQAEADELTELMGVKMPKRMTAVRWLWTLRNRPELAAQVAHVTTPGGWLAHSLTDQRTLGIGDASGMFPVDPATLEYDTQRLNQFDQLLKASGHPDIRELSRLLPAIRRAGEDGGLLSKVAADALGLPQGIPVAPAEGDQPAAMVGSLIGDAGMVSMSFGTSVCANSVGDRAFSGVSPAIDHFCAADGKPINMVWLRNGTTFMNAVVEMFARGSGASRAETFQRIMPQLLTAPDDCGGLIAFPFMDDEPGIGITRGGTATLFGLGETNAKPGEAVKAALLATMFNLRIGSEQLSQQGFPRDEIILSGGLTRTPELGQVLADVFATPVTILDSGSEGSAWGAALLAKYRHETIAERAGDWSQFLGRHATGVPKRFQPTAESVQAYDRVYATYRRLLDVHAKIEQALLDDSQPNS